MGSITFTHVRPLAADLQLHRGSVSETPPATKPLKTVSSDVNGTVVVNELAIGGYLLWDGTTGVARRAEVVAEHAEATPPTRDSRELVDHNVGGFAPGATVSLFLSIAEGHRANVGEPPASSPIQTQLADGQGVVHFVGIASETPMVCHGDRFGKNPWVGTRAQTRANVTPAIWTSTWDNPRPQPVKP